MFVHIIIVLYILSEFLSLINAKERLQYNDLSIRRLKEKSSEPLVPTRVLFTTLFRLFFAIAMLVFWVYAFFFIPYLRLIVLLNTIVGLISVFLLRKLNKHPNPNKTFKYRLWIIRIDSIISVLIWLPQLLTILSII